MEINELDGEDNRGRYLRDDSLTKCLPSTTLPTAPTQKSPDPSKLSDSDPAGKALICPIVLIRLIISHPGRSVEGLPG